MGFTHSTEHFYGIHVPEDAFLTGSLSRERDLLDAAIGSMNVDGTGLGYIEAGGYDRDELFLSVVPVGQSSTVKLGTHRMVNHSLFASQTPKWDAMLWQLIHIVGYADLGDPGWIVVPDVS